MSLFGVVAPVTNGRCRNRVRRFVVVPPARVSRGPGGFGGRSSGASCPYHPRRVPLGHGDRQDVHVPATKVAADVEPLQQRGEFRLVRRGDCDEEQDAAALACAALGEEAQSFVTAGALQVLVEDGFSVGDASTHRADPGNLRYQHAGVPGPHGGIPERRQVCLELAAQPSTCEGFIHGHRLGAYAGRPGTAASALRRKPGHQAAGHSHRPAVACGETVPPAIGSAGQRSRLGRRPRDHWLAGTACPSAEQARRTAHHAAAQVRVPPSRARDGRVRAPWPRFGWGHGLTLHSGAVRAAPIVS